jgi:hypothetical protein
MQRKRQTIVRRVLEMPVVVWDDNGGVIGEAHLRDVSDFGASLRVDSSVPLPQRFRVTMTESGRVYRICELVRRSPDIVDVRFVARNEDDALRTSARHAG